MTPQERISKGLCPQCGGEAAPYRLCFACRQKLRLNRCIGRGVKTGVVLVTGNGRNATYTLNPMKPTQGDREWNKWATQGKPPEDDGRFKPRLRGVRVDVEGMLVAIIEQIGRGCTIEEIAEAWGHLRAKRDAPLPMDLARVISAKDKRERKARKYAEPDRSPSDVRP